MSPAEFGIQRGAPTADEIVAVITALAQRRTPSPDGPLERYATWRAGRINALRHSVDPP